MLENGEPDQQQIETINTQISTFENRVRVIAQSVFELVLPASQAERARRSAYNINIQPMLVSVNPERPVSPFFNRTEPLQEDTSVREMVLRRK